MSAVSDLRRRASAVATLALAALALAGCNGGGNDEPAAPAAGDDAGAAELEAADTLCREAQVEQEELRRERGGAQVTLADRARLLVELAPSRERLAARLDELGTPERRARLFARLVAVAERRGAASTRAGERWLREAPRRRVAAAAAREHDERELFVELARELGLRACAEKLAPRARAEIDAAIERGLGGTDRERCGALGSRLLDELYGGGVDACVEFSPPLPRAARVRVTEAEGMAGVFAVARVRVESVEEGEGRHRLRLVHEDGAYRIDKID